VNHPDGGVLTQDLDLPLELVGMTPPIVSLAERDELSANAAERAPSISPTAEILWPSDDPNQVRVTLLVFDRDLACPIRRAVFTDH
jgi:hypothetical protein